ncbi:MAG: DUF6395 domain-containing protein, partial [Candidatus Poseidoniaceae archaeon]|nr:DUF6395 domain-containing protein [Candidatus Poseidoniaceae archaeon]
MGIYSFDSVWIEFYSIDYPLDFPLPLHKCREKCSRLLLLNKQIKVNYLRLITRIKMRRAYNSGEWRVARNLALKIIELPKEKSLARSIVIRSYWNEKNYSMVERCIEDWNDMDNSILKHKLVQLKKKQQQQQISRQKERMENIPTPEEEFLWNSENLASNFTQEGNIVWLKTPTSWVHWQVPDDFELQNTNNALLELAVELLLRPWHKEVKKPFTTKRKPGEHYALSFSAGTDSTAAMILMPDTTILGYHQRNFSSMLKHDNAQRLIRSIDKEREVIIVKSNHEHLRELHGKQVGFSTDYSAGVHLVLLADYLNLKGIAFGMPIDNGWLEKGRKFRNFKDTPHWKYWSSRFEEAGLKLVLPINMISEAGAMEICCNSSFMDELNSCMRGDGKSGCGKCWKCFHKNGPLGRPINIESKEIQTFLNKRPLRTAMHAIWAINKMDLGHLIPDLE